MIETQPKISSYKKLTRTRPVSRSKETIMRSAINSPVESVRALTKESLFRFMKYFWDAYSEDPFIPNWHIEMGCKELEKIAWTVAQRKPKKYDLLFNFPPGTTKTALVSIFFPAWCWVNWYWMRFITTSHSDPLSLESAEYCRDIIRSEKFQQIFPEIGIKQDKDKKSNFRVVLRKRLYSGRCSREKQGGGRVSTSVGSRITGFHAHIIIWDDLVDPKRADSEAGCREANAYIDKTLSTRKTDKRSTVTIGMMQRLSQNDPTAHLLKKKKENIRHICLPGEIRNYRDQVKPVELISKYTEDGLMDPVRMSWLALKDLEADLGQYGYAGQVGQRPTPPGGGMFKVDHFRIIDKMPPPVSVKQIIRYWDKAATDEKELSKGKDAAYTAGVKIAVTDYGKWIVMDVVRGRWETHERERIIRETAEADGKDVRIYIEQEPGSGGKDSARSTITSLQGYSCEADTVSGKGSKSQRADTLSVQVNIGNVLLLAGLWNYNYIEEFRYFPFSTYKDQVDASSGAFNKLTKKREVRVL